MSAVVGIETRDHKARVEHLEREVARLQVIIAHAYEALRDGRRGDALAQLRPKHVTAPIAATGDQA